MLSIGDRVRLNDEGLRIIGGVRSLVEIEAAKDMQVLDVETMGDGSWAVIEVSGPIGQYLLTDDCVDRLP